jgi:hypothetical protein
MIAKYRIVISGMFEPIAHELKSSGLVEVDRANDVHLFFRIRRDVVGLARPTDDGWAVEVLLTDGTGGAAAGALVEQLRGLFQDYTVSGPIEQQAEPTY